LLPLDAQQGPPRGPRPARTRKVVLAWADTRNGIAQHDFTSHALSVIERLGYETGLYDTYIRTDSNIIAKEPKRTTGEPASGGRAWRWRTRSSSSAPRRADRRGAEEGIARLRSREGKGFVAAHTGLTAFESGPNSASCSAAATTGIRGIRPGR
jgi:hypothetical protein